jgi:hypothetical protein
MTFSEENYLKTHIPSHGCFSEVSTNAITEMMNTKASSIGCTQEINQEKKVVSI